MSRNSRQVRFERPLCQLNRRLADKIESTKAMLTTRNFNKVHHDARENQLDSMFLNRKQKLLSICKENKLIFEKIYTQKTAYDRSRLEESYRTNKQISQRMLKCKQRARERLWDDGETLNLQRRTCHTRISNASNQTRQRLPSLDERPISFFNDMYDLPQQKVSRTVATSSSHTSRSRKGSRLFKIKDFMMF